MCMLGIIYIISYRRCIYYIGIQHKRVSTLLIYQQVMKCKYRVRWFSSKGAFLVLLWTLLTFSVSSCIFSFLAEAIGIPSDLPVHIKWVILVPIFSISLVSAQLSGWLADAKFGNYKVFRAGAVLLFIATVMNCLLLILEVVWGNNQVFKWIHLCLVSTLSVVGTCSCLATALPLGLDQMPDASSSSITSYIAWFVCSIFIGFFLGKTFNIFRRFCSNESFHRNFTLICALLLVVYMSIVLISNFFCKPKWLIIEPKSPQSLTTIYRVLKFAAKHKSPLNRSAFTYWEEDIPSRIDLGKSKYGGPFTTEQVEDVKTVLRLLAISLPFSFLISSSFFQIGVLKKSTDINLGLTLCTAPVNELFMSSYSGYCIVGIISYEFVIYPLIRNRPPSILKRIGAVSLVTTLVSFVCFILKLAHYLSHSSETATEWIILIFDNVIGGLLFQLLLTSVIELLSSQSPYNMRGMLASVNLSLILLSVVVGLSTGNHKIGTLCTQSWCSLVLISVKTALCLIGFLLFCVVARWYKTRVRDEDYSPQRVVEEVYDRYLTAAAVHSRSYAVSN